MKTLSNMKRILAGLAMPALAILSVLLAGSARAESVAYVGCYGPGVVMPPSSATIPANLPAFVFRPAQYSRVPNPPTIEDYAIEVLSADRRTKVPVLIEARPNGDVLIKPQELLPVGSLVVSFLDWCGAFRPDLGATPSRRDESYKVGAPVALPSTPLTAELLGIRYFVDTGRPCDRPSRAAGDVQVILPPAVLAFPLLEARAIVRGTSHQVYGVSVSSRMSLTIIGSCGEPQFEALAAGTNSVVLELTVLGSPTVLRTTPLEIVLDCAIRPADAGAPFCGIASPEPDAGVTARVLPEPAGDSGIVWTYSESLAFDGSAAVSDASAPDIKFDTSAPNTRDANGTRPASTGCSFAPHAPPATGVAALALVGLLTLLKRRR